MPSDVPKLIGTATNIKASSGDGTLTTEKAVAAAVQWLCVVRCPACESEQLSPNQRRDERREFSDHRVCGVSVCTHDHPPLLPNERIQSEKQRRLDAQIANAFDELEEVRMEKALMIHKAKKGQISCTVLDTNTKQYLRCGEKLIRTGRLFACPAGGAEVLQNCYWLAHAEVRLKTKRF